MQKEKIGATAGTELHPGAASLRGLKARLLPYGVLLVTLGASILFWRSLDAGYYRSARTVYDDKTAGITARIVGRLREQEQVLLGGVGLFNATGEVSRQQWRRYVSAQQLDRKLPGILGMGYTQWLTPREKNLLETQIRREGFREFSVRPQGARDFYTAIIYLEPFNWRNQRAFGYDMFSEPVRRAAMENAVNEGTTTIAGKIVLVQETEKGTQNGMLMYLPVYRAGMPTRTREERWAALRGYVYSPIRMNDFISGTLGKFPDDIAFDIYDGTSCTPESRLFSSLNGMLPAGYRPDLTSSTRIQLYGRTWTVSYRSLSGFSHHFNRFNSIALLVGGILLSILSAFVTSILVDTRERALRMAGEMVKELQRAQDALSEQALQLRQWNVTLGKRVHEEVAKNRDKDRQLIQQDKLASLGQLAAGVAHEINNPIGFISSNLRTLGEYCDALCSHHLLVQQLLAEHGSAELQRMAAGEGRALGIDHIVADVGELIVESQDGAQRVAKIVNDLKGFSRLDSPEREAVELNSCLESALAIAYNELKYRAMITKEYGELPLVQCHPGQLNQVFMNLLVNAGHALMAKGEIALKTWFDAGYVYASVSDTGHGMTPEIMEHIFEPFFTTKEVGKGTGLGLSISYDIIKKHDGELSVQSAVGAGSTFTVKLPRDPAQGEYFSAGGAETDGAGSAAPGSSVAV